MSAEYGSILDRPGARRAAGQLVLVLSGVALIALRWTAGAQSDLQVQVERLQVEVAHSHSHVLQASATCATPAGQQPREMQISTPVSKPTRGALVKEAPVGIDACARMENADAKVLGTLGE